MGFFDLFKPKWKHSNDEVRKIAVWAYLHKFGSIGVKN